MAKCWTCGTQVSGHHYNCPTCENSKEIKTLRKEIGPRIIDLQTRSDSLNQEFSELTNVVSEALTEVKGEISEMANAVVSAVEWGFQELSWSLYQQTEVLLSIDQTLKTPSETKANEWRNMAEELRSRRVYDEAEKFFLKAVETNPLDYRIYVGLAETYLQTHKFDLAKTYLEKSLPHAPKQEIDYKSYSYRLIGHIYECEENYDEAVAILGSAIELSPDYIDGHYDYSQYCSLVGRKNESLVSLRKAIQSKPSYFYLASREKNFDPLKSELQELLSTINIEAYSNAMPALSEADLALNKLKEIDSRTKKEVDNAVSKITDTFKKSEQKPKLCSIESYKRAESRFEDAKSELETAKDKISTGDYLAFLEAKIILDRFSEIANSVESEIIESADRIKKDTDNIIEKYNRNQAVKRANAWRRVPGAIIGWPLLFGFIGFVGGCVIAFTGGSANGAGYGMLLGILSGLGLGVYKIMKELE